MQVEPKFHEGASNLEELVPFEECIELHSTEKSVVMAPEYLLLTHNGRSFKLVTNTLFCRFFFKVSLSVFILHVSFGCVIILSLENDLKNSKLLLCKLHPGLSLVINP